MAKTETPERKPLTKTELDKIRSATEKLAGELTSQIVESVHTEGISPKLSQQIAYQVGMVKYAVRNMEALQESLEAAAKQRSKKAAKAKS